RLLGGRCRFVVVVVVLVVVVLGGGRTTSRRAASRGSGTRRVAAAPSLQLVVLEARDHDRHVARALADADATTAGTWPPPLERGALIGEGAGNEQLVLGHVVVVLRVGDGGVEELADVVRGG